MTAKAKVLDFTGVEDRAGAFRPRRKKEGDYYAHVVAVDDHTSKEGNEGWVFTIKIDGDSRASYAYYVNFSKEQLWKARGLCTATGMKAASSRVKMDPNKLVGRALAVALVDDEYEGRLKSTIDGVFPTDDLTDPMNEPTSGSSKSKGRQVEDDEDEDDEEEAPPAKKAAPKKRRAPEPDEDEDDEEEEERPARKAKRKPEPEPDDDEDDEDDEDEEPAPRKKAKAAAPAKKASAKKRRAADDEDDELDLDEL